MFNSIQAHNLNICRGFFTGGESIINYLKSLDIDLFLTANDDSAKAAIDNGIPAATMITSAAKYMTESTELRVAFDGDAFQVVYNAKINERNLIFCLASAMGDILLHRLDCAK